MCGARAVLAHLNSLLAVVGGAALVACAVVLPDGVANRASVVPGGSMIVMSPYVLGPLLLVLSHVCVGALYAAPPTARALLVLYAVGCALAALSAGGVAGWAGYQAARWLREDEHARERLAADTSMRAWLQPLISDYASEEGVRAEVVSVLTVSALTLLLLLAQVPLALAARPRRKRDDEHPLRPCSSVYYEPTAPAYKTPLQDPSAWQ